MTAEIPQRFTAEQIAAQDECLANIRRGAEESDNRGIGVVVGSRDVLKLADAFAVPISEQGRNFLNTHEWDYQASSGRYTNITREDLIKDAREFVRRIESQETN